MRDLFIRLQGGTPLTPQDKRDAWPGGFTEFVLIAGGKEADDQAWHGWDLFKDKAKGGNKRQLAAQVFMLYWNKVKNKKFCDIKSSNIDEFYHEHVGFDRQGREAKEANDFKKICDVVSQEFDGHPKLVRHHLIHLVLLVADLKEHFVPDSWKGRLAEALAEFKPRCKEAQDAANKKGDIEHKYIGYYFEYSLWTSTQSDQAANIQRRHVFFYQEMIALLGAIRKDDNRNFNPADREHIFYRDNRQCQYCEMEREQKQDVQGAVMPSHKVDWEKVEIHHVDPHAEGGRTMPSNGALVHKDCHPKAESQVHAFKEWWEDKKRKLALATEVNVRRNAHSRKLPPDGTELRVRRDKEKFRNMNASGVVKNRDVMLSGEKRGVHKSLSSAATAVTGHSTNGWKFWEIKLPETNEWILADEWRERL